MTRKVFLLCLFLAAGPLPAPGQRLGGGGEAHPALTTHRASLQKWQEMRFGMFIHWGPVTLRGTELGWSRGTEVRIEEYDNLYREFNPVLFNAEEWVGIARAAGMKYLVITSKHHDGFCLWDSKYTDYDIMSSPFRHDVLKELAAECSRQGIMFCTYYSILDWRHPHYPARHGGDNRPAASSDMNLYRTYVQNQVTELVGEYGTNILWFDGEWENPWTHEDGMSLYAYARRLKDDLLINNRVDKGRAGMHGMTTSERFAGDFGTPEQEIGLFDNQHPWESCITIGTQWSWKPNDRLKSAKECIQMLARTAGGGGNLLLNVSPMLDGRIEQRQIDCLKGIGRWLARYGESIYGTTGGPFMPTSWLSSTSKGNAVYVHLLKLPEAELQLPAIPQRRIMEISLLGGGPLRSRTEGDQVVIRLPQEPVDENDAVLVMNLDGPAEGVAPLEVPRNRFRGVENAEIVLQRSPSPTYPANGASSLIDKDRGTLDHRDGAWLGFEQDDFEAVFDMQMAKRLGKVTVGCLQAQQSWIFLPTSIEVSVSDSGTHFRQVGRIDIGELAQDQELTRKEYVVDFEPVTARFLKIRAANAGLCPPWHKGAGGKAWLFVDEVQAEK